MNCLAQRLKGAKKKGRKKDCEDTKQRSGGGKKLSLSSFRDLLPPTFKCLKPNHPSKRFPPRQTIVRIFASLRLGARLFQSSHLHQSHFSKMKILRAAPIPLGKSRATHSARPHEKRTAWKNAPPPMPFSRMFLKETPRKKFRWKIGKTKSSGFAERVARDFQGCLEKSETCGRRAGGGRPSVAAGARSGDRPQRAARGSQGQP